MGSYAYCQTKGCECGLDKPTPRQILENDWTCWQGHHNQLHSGDDRDSVILDMEQRIDELTLSIHELREALDATRRRLTESEGSD